MSIITIEVSITDGIQFFLVGLPDSAIKESQQRISNTFSEYGYRIPGKKIIINLAPANIRKEGSSFDLAIAIGILSASGQIASQKDGKESLRKENRSTIQQFLDDTIILGELALDGSLRPIVGALPIINRARKLGFRYCILPYESALEGAEIEDIMVFGAYNIGEVIDIILYKNMITDFDFTPNNYKIES